jgi:outer membrane lipoprotein SlyB
LRRNASRNPKEVPVLPHLAKPGLTALLLALLAACSPDYSPDTYATRAVQQANKVEQGVVVGRRQIEISADGTTGAVTGAAAGGVAGTRLGGGEITSAFAGIGGGLLGGLLGTAVEKGVGTAPGFEYVVRKPNNELVSVVQRDETPLAIGQKVLVINGAQARIVADYTVTLDSPRGASSSPIPVPAANPAPDPAATPAQATPNTPVVPATPPMGQENLPPPATAPAPDAPAPAAPAPDAAPTAAPVTPAPAPAGQTAI